MLSFYKYLKKNLLTKILIKLVFFVRCMTNLKNFLNLT